VDNRIRSLREARGLSLELLAKKIATTNQQVSLLEAGRRRLTVDWLMRLAKGLDCHPWELVDESAPGPITSQDIRVLEGFRALNDRQRESLLSFLETIAVASAMTGRLKPPAK
jgi:transcriptional regulator with XRE-family HTH domain